MIMKKVLMFLFVPFTFLQCTDELSDIEAVFGRGSEYSSTTSENDPMISEIPKNAFKASYFNSYSNKTSVTERIENSVEQRFSKGINSNTFNDATSVFWVGDFDFKGGNYEISVQSDKNVTILIDDKYLFNGIERSEGRIRYNIFKSLEGVHRILIFYNMDKSQIADMILEYYVGLNTEKSPHEGTKSMKPTRIYSDSNGIDLTTEKVLPHIVVQWRKY